MSYQPIESQIESFQKDCGRIREEVGKMIVGQRAIIDGVIVCVLAGGNVLLEGVPGLGKTMLVRSLATVLGRDFSRIQLRPNAAFTRQHDLADIGFGIRRDKIGQGQPTEVDIGTIDDHQAIRIVGQLRQQSQVS